MIKCYKRWWPAIWTTIILLILNGLIFYCSNSYGAKYIDNTTCITDKKERENLMNAPQTAGKIYRERLNALFTKWDSILNDNRKELEYTLKNISTSMSIWVGLIAAICTILPIVLGINANMNFKYDLAHMEKIINETLRDKVKEQNKKLNKIDEQIGKSEKLFNGNQINQTLSDLAVHMRVISELQDFESKDRGTLSKPELYVKVMDNVTAELTKTSKKIESTEIDNKDNNTHIGITLMLCMLKRLLVSVENIFNDYELLTLQRLKAKIDKDVTELIKKDSADNKKAISMTIEHVNDVRKLFYDFVKSQEC